MPIQFTTGEIRLMRLGLVARRDQLHSLIYEVQYKLSKYADVHGLWRDDQLELIEEYKLELKEANTLILKIDFNEFKKG